MTDEMILVPRAELLAWAKAWLYENDPGDGTDCVTPFDWHLLKTPVEAHCTTCSCAPGMTPAIRFDTSLAEKDGAVRDHLIRMGWTPPAEAQPVAWRETVERLADGLYSKRHDARERGDKYDEGYFGAMLKDAEILLEAAPPSAPVGVEGGLLERLDAIHRQVFGKPYPTEALAQQSSVAPVGVPVDVVREYLDARACYDPALRHPNSPEGLRLREARNALDAAIALAQQPAPSAPVGVEEIREDDIAKIAWQAGFHLEKEDAEGEPTDDWQWPNSEGENMFPDLVKFSRKIAALAQQPAADRVCPNTLQACRCDKYTPCAAQQPAACAHSWHDYGKVNRAWCSRCNAVAVIGHEDRPYGVLSVTDDGEYRTNPIQQPEAVDGAMVERIAALLHEEATDEPWAVAGVEHDGPDRDYYRTLARKVIVRADQQPGGSDNG